MVSLRNQFSYVYVTVTLPYIIHAIYQINHANQPPQPLTLVVPLSPPINVCTIGSQAELTHKSSRTLLNTLLNYASTKTRVENTVKNKRATF